MLMELLLVSLTDGMPLLMRTGCRGCAVGPCDDLQLGCPHPAWLSRCHLCQQCMRA